jgi:acyl carrier protein
MTISDIQSAARHTLARLGSTRLDPAEITPSMRIKDELGIDSLRFIRLILEMESAAKRKLFTIESIARIKTVGDLDQALAGVEATANA